MNIAVHTTSSEAFIVAIEWLLFNPMPDPNLLQFPGEILDLGVGVSGQPGSPQDEG